MKRKKRPRGVGSLPGRKTLTNVQIQLKLIYIHNGFHYRTVHLTLSKWPEGKVAKFYPNKHTQIPNDYTISFLSVHARFYEVLLWKVRTFGAVLLCNQWSLDCILHSLKLHKVSNFKCMHVSVGIFSWMFIRIWKNFNILQLFSAYMKYFLLEHSHLNVPSF